MNATAKNYRLQRPPINERAVPNVQSSKTTYGNRSKITSSDFPTAETQAAFDE